MKFVRFIVNSKVQNGTIVNGTIKEITGDIFHNWEFTGVDYLLNEVKLTQPCIPNQIIGLGKNYVREKEDLPTNLPEIPVIFIKSNSSVIGPEDKVIIPQKINQVKFESELAVVIGKEAKNVSEEDVFNYIFGYTIGNDVTAPQYFHQDGHWTIGKCFETFLPLGPAIETDIDPKNLRVIARLNNEVMQDSSTELMILTVPKIISYLSKVITLKPGDVILTGTPAGSVFVGAGDVVECEIPGIGKFKNVFHKYEEQPIMSSK